MRVQVENPLADLLHWRREDFGVAASDALRAIADAGTGVMVVLSAPVSYTHLDVYKRQVYPSPIDHAHVVTSTTHKTLRGPRGGIIIAKGAGEEIEKKLQSIVFPGIQGGPLMHVIAAKAVAFKEALEPEFKACLLYTSRCV